MISNAFSVDGLFSDQRFCAVGGLASLNWHNCHRHFVNLLCGRWRFTIKSQPMKRLPFLFLFLATVAAAQNKPNWVTSKPFDAAYYVGIGSASKRLNDYTGVAKKNALQDLVSDIRVVISSTSILSQIDKNYQFKEEYESNIKTTAADEIRDFERVDAFEDETTYWVYYRLSKSAYADQKKKNLDNVKSMALQFYEKALEAEKNLTYATAIDFYFRTLLTLKDYWGENVEVTFQNKPLFLAVESYARLQQLLDQLNVRVLQNSVRIPTNGNARATFEIADANGRPATKIPVLIQSLPQRVTPLAYLSNEKGEVNAVFSGTTWNEQTREAEVQLNLKSFSRGSAEDRFYDYLILSLRVPAQKVSIEVQPAIRGAMGNPSDYFPFNRDFVVADLTNAGRYTFRNLRLVPIRMKPEFRQAVGNMGYYTSLHQAMLNNEVSISEASQSGTVNTLLVRNQSADTLFIMSGEILTGGKQDRVVARDILIPPGEGRVKIPVYCVEKGRWQYKGNEADAKFTEYYGMANEHLRDIIDHRMGQNAVWDEVKKSNQRDGVQSRTDAYTDHANNRNFRRAEQEYLDFFQNVFADDADVIGVIAVTANRVEGCDLFISNRLFQLEYQKLIYSYVDEAVTYGGPVVASPNVINAYANDLLDFNRQANFIEQRGQAFRKGYQVIHISTY
jgi:hypothetical protein